jgi:hypothetical protein
VPLFLAPGDTSGHIDLFDITLADPGVNPNGLYEDAYTLLGGPDGGANTAADSLGQASFSVTVTPEPSTGVILVLGLAGIVVLWRRVERAF